VAPSLYESTLTVLRKRDRVLNGIAFYAMRLLLHPSLPNQPGWLIAVRNCLAVAVSFDLVPPRVWTLFAKHLNVGRMTTK
jgi:hypothetical protein